MPPFDHPNDPRDFFLWIWEEWFPDENYSLDDLHSYEVVSDLDESTSHLRFKG